MPDISINLLIRCLTGAAQSGDQGLIRLSPTARRALAQELRERIDQNHSSGRVDGDAGEDPLAAAMQLAAYLDGRMTEEEKAAFESALAESGERRTELISAVTWLDALKAERLSAPAHLIEAVIALESPRREPVPEPWLRRTAAFVRTLVPRNGWILATSSVAAVMVAMVGLPLLYLQPPEPSAARSAAGVEVAKVDTTRTEPPPVPASAPPRTAAVVANVHVEERSAEGDRVESMRARAQAQGEREESERLAREQAAKDRLDQASMERERLAREEAERKRLELLARQLATQEAAPPRVARSIATVASGVTAKPEPSKATPMPIASLQPASPSVSPNAGPAALKRVALVIGNSAYRNAATLPGSANEAATIAALLKTAGFEVVYSRHDLGNPAFRQAIRDFSAATNDADIAVVFYAGHGIEIDGARFLVPVDARAGAGFEANVDAISLDSIVAAISPALRLRLVLLDTARDHRFAANTLPAPATVRTAAITLSDPAVDNTLVAFVSKARPAADDGRAANNPFTAALLKRLAEPGLDVRTALEQVRREVFRQTGRKQQVVLSGSLRERISLVPPRPVETVSAPIPPTAIRRSAVTRPTPQVDRPKPATRSRAGRL